MIAALVLRRLTGGRGELERVFDVLALVVCAFLAAIISAAFGPMSLYLGDVIAADELVRVFRTWTLGDAAGVLVAGARHPDVVRVRLEGHPAARPRRESGHARCARGAGRGAAATRRALHRVPGALVGGAAPRASRRRHGDPRRLLDHRLEHGAKRGTVRAGIDHRQPPRHAALHRDRGDHFADPRCSDRRAHARSTRAGGRRGDPARARRRAGGAAQGRHARCRRGVAEPRLRAGDRGGRPAAGAPRRERHAVRRRAKRDGRRRPGARTAGRASRSVRRSTSTATRSSRRCCAAAPPSAWSYEETSGDPGRDRARASATAPRWRRRSPSAEGCGACWRRRRHRTTPLPDGLEQRLCDFAELVAQALANADAYEKLAASRARLIEVGDAERMRLERNLHDGAQQRLVSVSLELNMVAAKLESDPRAARRGSRDGPGRARPGARGAARAGPRHPPGHPHGARSRPSARCPADAGADPCRRSRSCPSSGCRPTSKRRRTTSSPRRSRTSASTRARPARRSASAARTGPQQ